MARKEINLFSVSFLDLLSGALGAVIILYIIVPKMSFDEEEALQTLQELQVEVTQVEQMMEQLENSVEKELFQELESKIKSMQEKIETLAEQVKELQQQLKDAQTKLAACEEQLEKLKNLEQELEKVQAELKEEQGKRADCESKLAKCPENFIAYKEWMDNCGLTLNDPCPRSAPNVDVGFKFKGKKVVFLIDVSGSMAEEDKMGQVKAGLKMLVTTMEPQFNIDMVQYPNSTLGDYKAFFNSLRPMNDNNKSEIFRYLNSLRPDQGTPTRATLKYALRNYPDLTDIVLLSDGIPTLSGNVGDEDNVDDIIREITSMNGGRVNINCIGVGNEFLTDPTQDKVRFLRELAKRNNGFFVGF